MAVPDKTCIFETDWGRVPPANDKILWVHTSIKVIMLFVTS